VAIQLLRGGDKRTGDATLEAARHDGRNSLVVIELLQYDEVLAVWKRVRGMARKLARHDGNG
jgi:hypothetical protein